MGYLKSLLDNALISRNQLSLISGIANSYLSLIDSGKIKKLNRDKLIYIAVALNLNFQEANDLLNYYNFKNISDEDVIYFIKAAERRKIVGIQPLYDTLSFDLLLISLERIPGNIVIISDRISNKFLPPEYASFKEKIRGNNDLIYLKIKEACVSHRRLILDDMLKKYTIHHLICHDCLLQYINKCNDKDHQPYIINHFKSFFHYIRQNNYKCDLIDKCNQLRLELKFFRKRSENKVFFIGQERDHKVDSRGEPSLIGFATDSRKIFQYFESEYKKLNEHHVIKEYSTTPEAMISYIKDIFRKKINFSEWE